MKSLKRFFLFVFLFTYATFAQNGGYAVKFNGTDGYAVATMNTGNTNSTATIEMWFTQLTAQAGAQYIADLRSVSGGNYRRVMPFLNSSIIGICCAPNTGNDNNAITQSTGVTVTANVWYHIAVTINGPTLKMYVNGKLYITTSLIDAYALTGTEVLTIASDYGNTVYANIKADEVRVWSTERTEAEIKANMYKELAGNEAGLMSYYKMSNGSGATLADNQTSGTYGGVLSSGYTWVASGAFADNRNALDFDGSDDYVDCGNSASVQRNGTQSFTLEAWVKPVGGVWGTVISKFSLSGTGYSLGIYGDNKPLVFMGNNSSDWNLGTTSTVALTPGVWSHIAATYDGSTIKIYVNGILTQSAAWTNGITDSGNDLLLGSSSGTTLNGQMDEARVWTVARTQAEIQETMCRTLIGNEAGLAAYYRLDQIDGTTVYDLTSNANNGTLTNMDPTTDWVTSDAFDTWIGSESSSWSDGRNWSKAAAPTSSNSAGIYKWALGNEATISTSPTINNLFISSTSSPTLSSSATINMNLLLGKNFDLNGQTVTLGSSGNLVEGTNRLYGTSGTITTTRSLSNISSLDVAGLGAKITTSANMGSTTITRGHAVQTGNDNVSIQRYYDITPTNNSSLNADLVFKYNDAELNSISENNLVLFKSTDNGTSWTNQSGIVSDANNTVTKSGIASFSRWTLGSSLNSMAPPPTAPVAIAATALTVSSFSANWNSSAGATKYYLDVSTSNTFSSFVSGFNNLDVGNVTTYNVAGLSPSTTYHYRVRAYDANGTSGNSNTITGTTIASAPALASIEESSLEYTDGSSAVQITNTITVSDEDDTNLESATIQINGNYQNNQDSLYYTNQNGINGSWNSSTGILALSGSSSIANYQTALRSIKYRDMSNKPDTLIRTISFMVNDGENNSNTLTRNINVISVNSAPVLDTIADRTIKEDSTFSIILSASDADADSINYSAESSDTSAVEFAIADTVLTIIPKLNWNGETNISVFASDEQEKDTASFKLTITPINDAPVLDSISNKTTNEDVPLIMILSATDVESDSIIYSAVSDINAVAISVTDTVLTITSKKDWNGEANISIITSDGEDSDTTDFELTVTPVNDAPVISKMETGVLKYIIKGGELSITDSLEVIDVDDINLASAVITISENYQKYEDKLFFENQNGITGSWNNEIGVLALSGTATTSNYQAAIKGVRYKNTYLTPTELTREISISVSDGSLASNTAAREIIITGNTTAPVLSKIENKPVEYKKGEAEVILTSTIEVMDSDNKYLFEGSISVDSGYVADEDILEFINTSTIEGSYDTTAGKLELKGQATVGEYQSALRSVKYKNIKGVKAESSTRRIIFTVRDGEWLSNKVVREIRIISPLKTPSNLTAEVNSNWEVELNWQDNGNDELGFEITRFGNNAEVKDSIGVNITTHVDKDVKEGYRYEYCVLAYNNETKSDTTSDNQNSVLIPLKPPTDLKAEVKPEGTINLTWMDNSSAEINYIVERSVETQDNYQEIKSCKKDSCSYCDKDIINNKKYYYRVYASRYDMVSEYSNVVEATGIVTDVTEELAGIPIEYKLHQNYPNPFNPTTKIRYSIPKEGAVQLKVYNILGQEVQTLVNRHMEAGTYEMEFDCSNLPSGIYFCWIKSGGFSQIKKMMLMK